MNGHRKRPITYSGCWTCKARKVKCDETPGSCKACAKTGLTCGGYGIRLRWMSPNDQAFSSADHTRIGRRRIDLGRNAIHRFSLAEVDEFLMKIELDSLNGVVASNQGPFTSFSASCSNEEPAPMTSSPRSDLVEDYDFHMATDDLNEHHPELDDKSDPSALVQHATPQSVFYLWSQPQAHICDNPETNLLFKHYSLHVANILQPLSHIGNPYRSLYVPAALEGSMETLSRERSADQNVRLCIFHSLVATAAFHMSSCNSFMHQYHKTGILHRQMALRYMQLALAKGTSQSDYRHFMVALCSLLTIGVMEGSIVDFQVHIQAMLRLRESRQHWKMMSLQTSRLNDMSSFMMLIANTTSCHPPTMPSLHLSQKIPRRPQSQTRCYEFTYGVTAEIAHAIEETLELGRKLSSYDKIAPQQEIPGEILEACESLGNQLLSWSLDDDLAKTVFPDDETMQVIFSHHAHAWHLSALVYYLQQIQGSSRSDIAEQVAMVSSHLHTVEDIKAAFPDNQMAPITWPAFIASCSSLDRETWVLWWARVQRYGIGTMKRQFEVVQEVWSALDTEPQTNWLEIIRRRKIEVLAL